MGGSLIGGTNRSLSGPLSRQILPSSVLACQLCERLQHACGRKCIQANAYGLASATPQARAKDQVAAAPVTLATADRAKRTQALSFVTQRYLLIVVTTRVK